MTFRAKRKYNADNNHVPFPIVQINPVNQNNHSGILTGCSVEIFDVESIKSLYEQGGFGVGSQSRSVPAVLRKKTNKPKTIFQRQYDLKLKWNQNFTSEIDCQNDLEVIKDDCKDDKSVIVPDPFEINESLVLTLEEAFFLHYSLKCLQIKNLNNIIINTEDIWIKFCSIKTNFVATFVAYHYLRANEWVVKSGIKFGGDFLLYKQGPQFYHSSYIVYVEAIKAKIENHLHSLDSKDIQRLNRIAETSKKQLIIFEVYYPKCLNSNDFLSYLKMLESFTISQMTLSRFLINQEKE